MEVARARQAESKLASDLATEQTRANRKEGELAQSIKSLENNNKLALANTEQKVCAPLRQPAAITNLGREQETDKLAGLPNIPIVFAIPDNKLRLVG